MKKTVIFVLVAVLCAVMFVGCSPAANEGGKTVVNFLNWGDYIDPEVIPMFEEENPDITINMTTTDSNEAMYVTTATEGSQIDVIIPSEYMVQRMMQEDMLAEFDHSKMENYEYVEEFLAANCGYDPEGTYSLPYSWGTFGILYNETMVDEPVDDWDILFNDKYSGQVLMYDSIRDTLGVALIELGYSINSTNQQELDMAAELLIQQKPGVLAYGTDDLRMSMANESAAIAIMYAGDAVYTMQDNENLTYVVPSEGANIFVDSMVIMKNTDVYDAALRFVDFMLRPDIAAKNAAYTGYSTPEDAAMEFLDAETVENSAFNPPKESLVNCQYYEHLEQDALKLYEDAWLKVKTAV